MPSSIAPGRSRARTIEWAVLVVVLVALSAVTIAPLWSCEYPPMTDLPQHAAAISVLVHHDEAAWGFRDSYAIDLWGRPTASFYLVGATLARAMPLLEAVKVTVALAMLSVPFGLLCLFLASKKDPLLAVLGFVPLYGTLLHWGFVNYLLAAGLYLLALAALQLDLNRPSPSRAIVAALASVAVFFTHVYGVAVLAVTAVPIVLVRARGIRGRLRGLVPLVPCGLVSLSWWVLARPPVASTGPPLRLEPFATARLSRFVDDLAGGLDGPEASEAVRAAALVAVGIVAIAAIDLVVRRLRRQPISPGLGWRAALGLALVPLIHLVLYLVLPMEVGGWWFVFPREAFFVAATLPLALPAPRSLPLRVVALVAALVVAPLLALDARQKYPELDRYTAGFDAVVRRIPRGADVMALISSTRAPGPFAPLIHFGAWAQALRGGRPAWSFAVFGATPVYHPSGKEPRPLPRRWEWTSTTLFRPRTHGRGYDHFLVGHARVDRLFRGSLDEVEVVAHRGAWSYVRRKGATLREQRVRMP